MTTLQSQITAIFTAQLPAPGAKAGDGWRVTSVQRDLARFHSLSCGRFSCELSGGFPRGPDSISAHMILVRAGSLTVRQWGHRRALGPGDIFVSCSWVPTALDGEDGLEALIVELPAWWAIKRMMDHVQILPDLHIAHDFFAAPVINELAQSVFDMSEDDKMASRGMEMLADVTRSALAVCANPNNAMPRAVGRMGAILAFIARNLDQPGLSAKDAAASLKCSVRTIYKTCAAYGTSFASFLSELRLVTAEYQLLRTNERISQIAYSVGFSSLPHFSRLFRARFGISANQYRRHRMAQFEAVGDQHDA